MYVIVIVVTLRECKVRPCDVVSIQLYCNFRLLKDQGATGNEAESVIRVTGYVRWLRVMIALGYILYIALVS